jgi:hypothetical protein
MNPKDTPDPVNRVLVQRLKSLYWPKGILDHYTRKPVLTAKPVSRFRDENRTDAYDFGRVHYFITRLRDGETLAPVDIDWTWRGMHPDRVVMDDGHHRFVAHVLARKRWMLVSYGGPVDALRWMEGKGEKPDWL